VILNCFFRIERILQKKLGSLFIRGIAILGCCSRRERPCGCAAEQRDEVAPSQ
jgi:hypothetical protein